jgi:hypothetical protein
MNSAITSHFVIAFKSREHLEKKTSNILTKLAIELAQLEPRERFVVASKFYFFVPAVMADAEADSSETFFMQRLWWSGTKLHLDDQISWVNLVSEQHAIKPYVSWWKFTVEENSRAKFTYGGEEIDARYLVTEDESDALAYVGWSDRLSLWIAGLFWVEDGKKKAEGIKLPFTSQEHQLAVTFATKALKQAVGDTSKAMRALWV